MEIVKTKRGRSVTGIISLMILFCFLMMPFSVQAATLSDKQRELDAVKKQMSESRRIIEQKENEAQTLANEIAKKDAEIREAELAIQATALEIDKTGEEISIKESELVQQKNMLNESLRLMYEESETTLLETLLSSHSFSRVLDRMEYISVVKGKVDATIQMIEKIKADLEMKKGSLEVLKKQQEGQKFYLASERAAKDRLLQETRGEEAAFQQKLAAEQAQAKNIQSEMARMEAASRSRGSYDSPPSPFGFSWPTASHSISSGYRTSSRPNHTGIDIAGPPGTAIYASADGTVERTETNHTCNGCYSEGYANQIVIVHASGFRTRYAHLLYGGVLVSPGQHVNRGQLIGLMGSTGNSTGPHLHFEIMANGCIWGCDVNPLDYLP